MTSLIECKNNKLTLSVDAKAVEKAKKLGLNISEITEIVLKGFTFEPKKGEKEEMYQKYADLFSIMLPLMTKYDLEVAVAEDYIAGVNRIAIAAEPIMLTTSGDFRHTLSDKFSEDIHKIGLIHFFGPNEILTNLIDGIARVSENHKKLITELELARRIVEAIDTTLHP